MNDSRAVPWALCLMLLGSAGLVAGCAHSPKPPHSSLISEHRLQTLSTPHPPGSYCAAEAFHGYYGTCWRPWPHGWPPCVEPCAMCGTVLPEAPRELEVMPHPGDVPSGPSATFRVPAPHAGMPPGGPPQGP